MCKDSAAALIRSSSSHRARIKKRGMLLQLESRGERTRKGHMHIYVVRYVLFRLGHTFPVTAQM